MPRSRLRMLTKNYRICSSMSAVYSKASCTQPSLGIFILAKNWLMRRGHSPQTGAVTQPQSGQELLFENGKWPVADRSATRPVKHDIQRTIQTSGHHTSKCNLSQQAMPESWSRESPAPACLPNLERQATPLDGGQKEQLFCPGRDHMTECALLNYRTPEAKYLLQPSLPNMRISFFSCHDTHPGSTTASMLWSG